jgi:hypothetical protein
LSPSPDPGSRSTSTLTSAQLAMTLVTVPSPPKSAAEFVGQITSLPDAVRSVVGSQAAPAEFVAAAARYVITSSPLLYTMQAPRAPCNILQYFQLLL